MSHNHRSAVLACALFAGATSVMPIGAQPTSLQPIDPTARDVSSLGRPSVDSPDACAALPLEWQLRCQGGRNHTVGDIGAPYDGMSYDASVSVWHSQWHAVLPVERDRAATASIDAAARTAQDDAPVK